MPAFARWASMKFFNYTPYPAYLHRGFIEERRALASAMLRVTYDVVDGRLRPADEQVWPISPGPWDSPYGPLPGDQRYIRGGVDVMIFGSARSPRPVPRIDVEVQLGGSWRARVFAHGPRVWRPGPVGLVPGAPEPVREVPLTLAHAYGGKDRWDGIDVPFVDNPDGKGFYLEEASARGNPLPELEDPDAPIRAWSDRPEPVGTGACPQTFGPRVRRGIEFDAERGRVRQIRPEFYNDAFPKMIAPRAEPGDRVVITGVREDGPLAFTLPVSDIRVRIEVGDDIGERTPAIDQIGVEADHRRVFITYRYCFAYWMRPQERRSCMFGIVEPD
ncbi:MAG TPA: DUF2169 domain-containing protein [Nannocystis sp.]